jgi:hypothetical protein
MTHITPNKDEPFNTSEVSEELLMKHTKEIAKWTRLSGSKDEARSLEYVKNTLTDYEYDVHEYHFDSLVGYPKSAEMAVLKPGGKKFTGTTPALALSTPPRGVTANLTYVGKYDTHVSADLNGKIALIDGFSSPHLAKLSEVHGAVGQIFINDDHAHEGIVSLVWGTPTPETAHFLPKTPSISITRPEGEYLIRLLKKGSVKVRLKTRSLRRWKKIPVVTADLRGKEDDFVLFSGHIDSWYYGAMDNGTANATMLEVARIIAHHRDLLRRGLRLAFWSGHSHGRYSGSAWYADNFWEDLYLHCIAHVNIDSVGGIGATLLAGAYVMSEAKDFASSVVESVSGQKLVGRRFSRAGDQSFWGLGIPAMLMSLSEQPPGSSTAPSYVFGPNSGGLGWWWHIREDTVDKIDSTFLLRDAKIYVLLISKLCTQPILPFNYLATVGEIEQKLSELESQARGLFDLTPLIQRSKNLKDLVSKLNAQSAAVSQRIESRVDGGPGLDATVSKINTTIKLLGKFLIPVNYSKAGPFDHDLAGPITAVPVLDRMWELPTLKPNSDDFRFLSTRLKRESNKITYAFLEAERSITRLLQEVDS